MRKLMTVMATLGVAVLLLTSCEKAPQAEIDAATAAVNDAKAAQADVYANASFSALQDSLNAVLAGIEAENSKFFKNYSSSKEKLANVTAQAAVVKQSSEDTKVAIQAEVQAAVTEVTGLVAAGQALAENAPKGKEGATAVEAIKQELATIGTAVTEASDLLAKGELITARDKVNAAKEKAIAINAELQSVIDKYATAKKK